MNLAHLTIVPSTCVSNPVSSVLEGADVSIVASELVDCVSCGVAETHAERLNNIKVPHTNLCLILIPLCVTQY